MQLLAEKAMQGDKEAFVELMQLYEGDMYRIARGYFHEINDVEDVMQDTILRALEHIGELREPVYFKTWLLRILINRCNLVCRDRKHYAENGSEQITAAAHDAFSELEFRVLIDSLSFKYRTVLLLYYGMHFSAREIGDILKTSENTVRSRLRRARKELEKLMEEGEKGCGKSKTISKNY